MFSSHSVELALWRAESLQDTAQKRGQWIKWKVTQLARGFPSHLWIFPSLRHLQLPPAACLAVDLGKNSMPSGRRRRMKPSQVASMLLGR